MKDYTFFNHISTCITIPVIIICKRKQISIKHLYNPIFMIPIICMKCIKPSSNIRGGFDTNHRIFYGTDGPFYNIINQPHKPSGYAATLFYHDIPSDGLGFDKYKNQGIVSLILIKLLIINFILLLKYQPKNP